MDQARRQPGPAAAGDGQVAGQAKDVPITAAGATPATTSAVTRIRDRMRITHHGTS